MPTNKINNLKLGIFISAGLMVLIISLYLIGKNQNFFGSNFIAHARFKNVNGLMAGNNVRFSGIQVGTVNNIEVIDDSTIEISLLINRKMKPFIHQNSYVEIGNDGLMGNKVINITPNEAPAPEIEEGGTLVTKKMIFTTDMLETLSNSSNNIELLSTKLVKTLDRINENNTLWSILNDTTIPKNISMSLTNIRQATKRINDMSVVVNNIVSDINEGKGTIGVLLKDQNSAVEMKSAIENINKATANSVNLITGIDSLLQQLQKDLAQGPGVAHSILNDTALVSRLNNSMENIEKGTAAFNLDMEALKHNFLTKGYFKKDAKRKKKAHKASN